MKTALMIILTAMLLFGLSAGGSWAWKKYNAPKVDETAEKTEEPTTEPEPTPEPTPKTKPQPVAAKPKDEGDGTDRYADNEIPQSVRPRTGELTDTQALKAHDLSQKSGELEARERQLQQEQETFRVIFSDIRAEQAEVEKLRKETDSLITSLHDQMKILEEQQLRLRAERDSIDAREREATDRVTTLKESEKANVKLVGSRLDNMPPDQVARLFKQLAKDELVDTVVQLLSQMKERQAAKVLDEIVKSDAAMGADLVERLKRMRQPKGTKAAGGGAASQ